MRKRLEAIARYETTESFPLVPGLPGVPAFRVFHTPDLPSVVGVVYFSLTISTVFFVICVLYL